ncbi:MAG TPA: type-F conjugative transfer system pilin assembly protein TrbC [Alphaproteobacteria bacterium]|nr:type-F conjugative transfer system pilin assembly protein TrbC [Alphaproteobacteria bacterium]
MLLILKTLAFVALLSLSSYADLKVFISFSMNEGDLKILYKDVSKAKGKLLIKGLLNNSFKDTALKLKELGIVVDIDPKAFEENDIKVVPTFMVENKDKKDLLKGNVSLSYALEAIEKTGENQALAKEHLNSLKGEATEKCATKNEEELPEVLGCGVGS